MIYEKNMSLMRKKDISLYNKILEYENIWDSDIAICASARNEEPIIGYNKDGNILYFNSRYNGTFRKSRSSLWR